MENNNKKITLGKLTVIAGPMFAGPVPLEAGEIVDRDGFVFADFQPKPATDKGN